MRDSGIRCPTIGYYYEEKKEFCMDIMECISVSLDHNKEKYHRDIKETFVVRCNDIDTLLERFYGKSNGKNLHLLKFKLGLDYGRDFLKLVLSLRNENSVNRLVYLWVSKVPENYYNFQKIFRYDQISNFLTNYDVTLTVDLKAGCICIGLMAGRYPCIWCTWDSRLGLNETQVTCRSSLLHSTMFDQLCTMYSGDGKKYAIDCMGVEDIPSIGIWMSNTMNRFNIPELHLMLGVGQKLYDAIVTTMSEDEIVAHENLLRSNNIQRSTYHGNAFEGNAMRKMLKICNGLAFSPSNSAYIALKRFSDVVASCFGTNIQGEYIEHICQFEEAFNKTGLPCSTKVHILCRHIIPFIQNYLPPGKGLGYVSEQAVESSHSRFMKVWNRYKCNEDVESFAKCIYNTVCEANFTNYST